MDEDTIVTRQIPSKEQGIAFSDMAIAPNGDIWFVEQGSANRSALGLIRMDGIFTDNLEAPLP